MTPRSFTVRAHDGKQAYTRCVRALTAEQAIEQAKPSIAKQSTQPEKSIVYYVLLF